MLQHAGVRQREPELRGDLQLAARCHRGHPELQLPQPGGPGGTAEAGRQEGWRYGEELQGGTRGQITEITVKHIQIQIFFFGLFFFFGQKEKKKRLFYFGVKTPE